MSTNEKGDPAPGKATGSSSTFGDLVDLTEQFEQGDLDALLGHMEEAPCTELHDEINKRRAQWKGLSSAEQLKRRVGDEVRVRLLEQGIRQAELGRRLNKDRAWVTRLVQGKENLTLETLDAIATVLHCDPSDLLLRPPAGRSNSQGSDQEFQLLPAPIGAAN